jgi:hypothetical protein
MIVRTYAVLWFFYYLLHFMQGMEIAFGRCGKWVSYGGKRVNGKEFV